MSMIIHPRAVGVTTALAPLNAIPHEWDARWDALAQRASEPNAFAERWFVRVSAAHLPVPRDPRLLSIWRGPEMIGILPLHVDSPCGRLPVRHVTNWLHHHAFLGTPLIRAGEEETFWHAVLSMLDAADWAPGFLHINAIVEDGPVHRALASLRRTDIVHRSERAMLEGELGSQDYFKTNIRQKKRKEIRRQQARLNELGVITCDRLGSQDDILQWCNDFLALEASGWKGRAGSALGQNIGTRAFFMNAMTQAFAGGRLDMLRLALDGKPIAMLVNFMTPPGSFSFKIAFDEDYARFSPGVLIQLENLALLDRGDIVWMDSCAVSDHAMINSLWAGRRSIVRVTVPLSGARRRAIFSATRAVERAAALIRNIV